MGAVLGWVRGRGVSAASMVVAARAACLLALCAAAVGCAGGKPTVSNAALVAHLPGVNFSGLKPLQRVEPINASLSVPEQWKDLKADHNALFTNQQWKSPSGYTGTGIVYAHLPLPISAKTLIWLAKMEYGKRGGDKGKDLGEWTDNLGRPWFEAENAKYHVRGYAFVNGNDAWIVYFGYKADRPPDPAELSLAARCVDTVVPSTDEDEKKATQGKVAEASGGTPHKG